MTLHEQAVLQKPALPGRVAPRPLRILALSDNTSSGYHRIVSPCVLLEKLGLIELRLGAKEPEDISWADIVFWQRPSTAEASITIENLKKSGIKVIAELDDHYAKATYGEQAQFLLKKQPLSLTFLTESALATHAILVSTPGLDKLWREQGGNPTYIPHYIDATNSRWKLDTKKSKKLTYGWMGGDTHEKDLELIANITPDLGNFVIAGYKPSWMGPDVTYREPCTRGREPELIKDFDIGLLPLEPTDFNEIGKSDLKFLQYTMVGAVTIASPVGMLKQHKDVLFLSNDFNNTLNVIVNTSLLSKKLKKAQEYVLKHRTLYIGAKHWYNLFVTVIYGY